MPERPATYRPPGAGRRAPDTARPDATERGYGRAWRKFRLCYLADNPLCQSCKERGLVVEATVVDHVVPHRGDPALFWCGPEGLAPMCKPCHDRKTGTGL